MNYTLPIEDIHYTIQLAGIDNINETLRIEYIQYDGLSRMLATVLDAAHQQSVSQARWRDQRLRSLSSTLAEASLNEGWRPRPSESKLNKFVMIEDIQSMMQVESENDESVLYGTPLQVAAYLIVQRGWRRAT